MIASDELFDLLDDDADGALSREDLSGAARRHGWHWPEAPLFAVLDLLTVRAPLSRTVFARYLAQIARDPRGPFGEVLLDAPRPSHAAGASTVVEDVPKGAGEGAQELLSLLAQLVGEEIAERHAAALRNCVDGERRSVRDGALLLIDPQRAFTEGIWMRSIGPAGEQDVAAIQLAFRRCGRALRGLAAELPVGISRCPFPPDSYPWDKAVADILPADQPYFVKPGNSMLWPPTNGFGEWVERLLQSGKPELVIGGCTLNSCVRVSAVETQRTFGDRGLQVIVDLSLCGARVRNFVPSPLFGGASPVEAALREMRAAGVRLFR